MLDVHRLRLLRDLAHLGTIAAVAHAHAYTPSAVSQQLATLQREAGVALLERDGRGVSLTPAGADLVQHADVVLTALEAASASVAAARSGLSGTIRIGAFPTAVRTVLPEALVRLARHHPALDLLVTEVDPAAAPEQLRLRRLDVALLSDYNLAPDEPENGLDSVALFEETVMLATSVDALDTDDPVEGARHAHWIVSSPGTQCHTAAMRIGRAAGYTPMVRHVADDFTAVLALVAAGQGVALVPELGAVQVPDGVRLLPLPVLRRTRVAYRGGARTHPAVTACVDSLRAVTSALSPSANRPKGS